MRSQPDCQSLNSPPSANLSETFVTVHVEFGQIKTIVSFLVAQQIPFFMSSAGFLSERVPDKNDTLVLEEKPICEISNNRRGIEQVFQKYIIENIEMIPPNALIIAEEAGMGISQFKSQFKKRYGKSFYSCYIDAKMEYAANLLQQGLRASEVSMKIGYAHPIKFNKMFQKYFGMTPHKYQISQEQQSLSLHPLLK